jgi:hypothetical protein
MDPNGNFDNQFYVSNSEFILCNEIITSSAIPCYQMGTIINNNGQTSLPNFDFSEFGDFANRLVVLQSITITSNNGGAYALQPLFTFYNANTIIGSNLTDGQYFNPSYAETILKQICIIEPLTKVIPIGNHVYHILQNEMIRVGTLDDNCRLFYALVSTQFYIPIPNEHLFITIKGYLC